MGVPHRTLEDLMSKIQHTNLSPLGFNQKIYTELCTAHTKYQGIGMFDLNNSCMEFKVHLMQEYWNKDTCLGKMMKLAYETFLVDTGLGGDVFCQDYKRLHILAEESWFQHLWCLCDFLQVKAVLDKTHHVQPICKGDRCLMDAVIKTGRCKG